ncbi:MAG: hypothetical protein IJB45_06115 [Clostridia bacterium]|nr:hypothetical protein [Clostridia bacterium]
MTGFFGFIKSITKVLSAIICILPVILTMPFGDLPNTPVIPNESATNTYINEYLDPDISAHRSGAGIAPQNTKMAFETVLHNPETFGVDTFEFDVQITKDGELIIMHDLTYDATSNAVEYFGHKNVYASSLTLEEAKVLNMGENFEINGEYPYRGLRGDEIPDNLRIATCEEIIDMIEANDNGKKYNYIIEIKSRNEDGYRAADKLRDLIIEKDIIDRTIWASSKQEVANYMKSTYPDMPRSADTLEVIEFYFYARMNWDLNEADVSYIALQIPHRTNALSNLANIGTRKVINYAHKYNIAVQYWTVNDYEDAEYLINNGADCIMSDYPDMVLEAVKNTNK